MKFSAQEIGISKSTALPWNRKKALLEFSESASTKRLSRREIMMLRQKWQKSVWDAPPQRRITSACLKGRAIWKKLNRHDHLWLLEFNRHHRASAISGSIASKHQLTEARTASLYQTYDELMHAEPPIHVTCSLLVRSDDDPPFENTPVSRLLRTAAVAAILFDSFAAQALLELPNAGLGRLFKRKLAQVIGLSTALKLDINSNHEHNERPSEDLHRVPHRRVSPRKSLGSAGRLLPAAVVCEAFGISAQRLAKNVAGGQIFNVDVEGNQFHPAFFLAKELSPTRSHTPRR
ncbi:hypothetical protein [Paraburkholderia strydomiana]|uniref:hypothetical protein n=1 Tax=Paraburkholderia strydomiana TaxID=1245417 RepID=UPI0038B93979